MPPKRGRSTSRKAKQYKQARKSRRRDEGEGKFLDTVNGAGAITSTGSVDLVDAVPVGDTVNSRDGQRWRDIACHIRGTMSSDSATALATGKWMLVWDSQPNAAIATVADILDANSGTTPVTQFPNRDNKERFTILRSRTYTFAGNNTTAGQQNDSAIHYVDEYIKLPKMCEPHTTAADTTGAIGNRITGALLLLKCSDKAAGTTDLVFDWTTRVSFVDV